MYIARIPLRVSLLGGGSDMPEYYESGATGEVIGFAIRKYITIYASLPLLIDKSIIKYSKTETFESPSEIEHPLFREALKIYWNSAKKIELASFADIRSGTGLGSSSIFTVGLIGLLKKLKMALILKEKFLKNLSVYKTVHMVPMVDAVTLNFLQEIN